MVQCMKAISRKECFMDMESLLTSGSATKASLMLGKSQARAGWYMKTQTFLKEFWRTERKSKGLCVIQTGTSTSVRS